MLTKRHPSLPLPLMSYFINSEGPSFVVLRAGARWSLYDRVSFTDLVYHTPYRPYRCLGWPVTVVVVRVRLCLLQ